MAIEHKTEPDARVTPQQVTEQAELYARASESVLYGVVSEKSATDHYDPVVFEAMLGYLQRAEGSPMRALRLATFDAVKGGRP